LRSHFSSLSLALAKLTVSLTGALGIGIASLIALIHNKKGGLFLDKISKNYSYILAFLTID
jgi:hypothetical protein